ncbi:carbohydrate ABC transporter permease [Halobellus marinus]|uniref:carbohydrate ABC transporter permease n=1 Tax=Halobellus TaxID=1073986 RepID=UPI0028A6F1D0|nr:sugar ABC transporter permease [Halobellus sp. DFY28]
MAKSQPRRVTDLLPERYHSIAENEITKSLLFLSPAIFIFFLVSVFPIIFGIWMGLTTRGIGGANISFVGLENFQTLAGDADFKMSLWRGGVYAFYSVFVQTLLGVLIALVLNESFRFANIVRTIVILPYLVPTVAIAFVFRWILNAQYGVVNYVLLATGLRAEPLSFFSMETAMHSVVWISSWKFTIFVVLVVLARIQAIDSELYELAKINGANIYRRFMDVTLPNIKNVLLLVVLLRGIWMFNRFDVIWLLTQGGPLDRTMTLVVLAYITAFQTSSMGMAAAMVTVMFVLLLVSAMVYIQLFDPEREVEQ